MSLIGRGLPRFRKNRPEYWCKERSVQPPAALLLLVLTCLVSACKTIDEPAILEGRWEGTIAVQGQTQPMRVDFYGEPGNWHALTGKTDAPESSIPLMNVQYQNPRISFELNDGPARLTFEGTVIGDLIKASARGGERELKLELRRVGAAPAPAFKEEAIHFTNGDTTLNGTLLLPDGNGPHPAVVLIHGTGRQTRSEWRFFGMQFARNGVAALLYDKRDVGHDPSGMDLVDLNQLAGDALAAVNLLKDRKEISGNRIGLWGISQGGWVAPMVASQSPDVAFIITISAPGVTYADLNVFAVANRLRERGFSEAEISEAQQALRRLDDFMRNGNDPAGVQAMLEQAVPKRWFAPSTLPATLPTESERKTWLRWRDLDLDPVSFWSRVRVPVLLLYGERDDVVPVRESVERITAALQKAGNRSFTVKVFPAADHELTTNADRTNIVPGYFETVNPWVTEVVSPKGTKTQSKK